MKLHYEKCKMKIQMTVALFFVAAGWAHCCLLLCWFFTSFFPLWSVTTCAAFTDPSWRRRRNLNVLWQNVLQTSCVLREMVAMATTVPCQLKVAWRKRTAARWPASAWKEQCTPWPTPAASGRTATRAWPSQLNPSVLRCLWLWFWLAACDCWQREQRSEASVWSKAEGQPKNMVNA